MPCPDWSLPFVLFVAYWLHLKKLSSLDSTSSPDTHRMRAFVNMYVLSTVHDGIAAKLFRSFNCLLFGTFKCLPALLWKGFPNVQVVVGMFQTMKRGSYIGREQLK